MRSSSEAPQGTFTHPQLGYLRPLDLSYPGTNTLRMKKTPILWKTIPLNCTLPPEIITMLGDFRAMVNRLISWGLYTRIHDAWEMRDSNYDWFASNYGGRYASHYLHSACSVASQLLASWLQVGGNLSKRPYMQNPFARLDQMLVKKSKVDRERVRLRITLAARQLVYIDLAIRHKQWHKYSKYRLGELVIVPDGIRLLFQVPDSREKSATLAGVDLNFNRVVIATSDGRVEEMDISRASEIQQNHRERRERMMTRLPAGSPKLRKLLQREGNRERHRIQGLLYEYRPEFLALLDGRSAFYEDLSTCTQDCLRDASGKKFRTKLSTWVHNQFQQTMILGSPKVSDWVYARGTSSYCPFCGSGVEHPTWRISRCHECSRDFDRDRLSSVSVLVRGMTTHRKGEPWVLARDALQPDVIKLLREQCIINVLQSPVEGKTQKAIPAGLWEVPAGIPLVPGGPFIPNAPPNGPDGGATSAGGLERQQGSGTAVMPRTGYGANKLDNCMLRCGLQGTDINYHTTCRKAHIPRGLPNNIGDRLPC